MSAVERTDDARAKDVHQCWCVYLCSMYVCMYAYMCICKQVYLHMYLSAAKRTDNAREMVCAIASMYIYVCVYIYTYVCFYGHT